MRGDAARGGEAPINRPESARVLLVGEVAVALGPRLELSGHQPLDDEPSQSGAFEKDGQGANAPEAILLSPGNEGRLAELRRRWGAVPMLLGLRDDTLAGRIHCLASGADDFWLTDRPPSDLLTRLRLHLAVARRAAPASERCEPLRLGDLELDPIHRRVRRGGRLLSITAREYQLLLLLLRERHTVVSRERILREIWGDAEGAGSNVIEVYVRYLRQKLEQEGGRRLIHTVRGKGYCLAERWPLP
jgi:two-component system response regulator MprA